MTALKYLYALPCIREKAVTAFNRVHTHCDVKLLD